MPKLQEMKTVAIFAETHKRLKAFVKKHNRKNATPTRLQYFATKAIDNAIDQAEKGE